MVTYRVRVTVTDIFLFEASCFLLSKFSFSTNRGTSHLFRAGRLFGLKGKTVFGHSLWCQAACFLLLVPGMLERAQQTAEVKGWERWLGY